MLKVAGLPLWLDRRVPKDEEADRPSKRESPRQAGACRGLLVYGRISTIAD
jgi:hypothetical protein